MKRLIEKNINTAEEYNRIFQLRALRTVDEFDDRRWHKLLEKFEGGKLIDIGSLDSFIPLLAKRKYHYSETWGIDIAEEAIAEMKQIMPYCNYMVMDLYKTEFQDGFFDYAVLGEVIEHLEKPAEAIKEAMRILKPGGVLAISTPLEEAKEFGAVDHERHLWSFDEQDIKDLLSPYGKVKLETLRSIKEPVYKYCWPQLIAFCKKHD